MFSKEFRPLKRPKVGVPGYYPQDPSQKEDELSFNSLNKGFQYKSLVPGAEEFNGALNDFPQHFLQTKEYCLKVNQVEDERRRRKWVSDNEKKKLQLSKDNFFPVPLGRNRREIATQWFQDLASSKPLSQLAKKVPIFNKKDEIFEYLCEKDVPISRAAWYIKMSSAYNNVLTDSKLAKKKPPTDPSLSWTVELTKYMQDSVWRICNESMVMGRHDSHSRTPSTSGRHSPSDETLMEITHWQYMLHLSSRLYEENLLDKHEFIRWLVDCIEHVKSSDTKSLQLHLPLVLRHLLDIASCVSLARPLVTYCCERLAALFEVEQRLHKLHPAPKPETLERLTEGAEDDSVFGDGPAVKQEHSTTPVRKRSKSALSDKKEVASDPNEGDVFFHWCSHHQAVVMELICVVQTIAIRCPTAFVQVKLPSSRSGMITRGEAEKITSPLAVLPTSLSQLPLPTSLSPELQKKLLSGLIAAEAEIERRNKTAESRWSSMTVADLQTTSEGSNVRHILQVLEVLNQCSFTSCRAHNPLTTLYCRIAEVQRSNPTPLTDDMLTMLLCQWAVTPYRYGDHRPLVVAQILCQRQTQILKGESWSDVYSKNSLDESWEQPVVADRVCEVPYPLQAVLVKFLDNRAPLPEDLSAVHSTDPFFKLLVLFSELIRLDVFSYRLYLSTLIARGESRPPIIPSLPFANGGKCRKRQDSFNLSIPLPALKKGRYDQTEVSLVSSESPVSSPSFGLGLASAMELITGSPPFKQRESATILEDRAKQLQMLETEHTTNSSHLSQLMGFDPVSTDTGAPNSPVVPIKSEPDPFSFFSILDDEQSCESPLSKKQLIFAAYFPITDTQLSQQVLNERSVVLCGIGKQRSKVEAIIKKITDEVEQYFRILANHHSAVLPDEQKLKAIMTSFQTLPAFEQNVLATSCEKALRQSLAPSNRVYPVCGQLVFVCELLKTSGSISQIVQLVVDIVACSAYPGEVETLRAIATPCLPNELRLPVVGILQRYLSCLLLSQHDTTTVFEGLLRVLESPHHLSSHKTVFLLLHKLYSNCSYLQKTFRQGFGTYSLRFGERFGMGTDWYPPTASEGDWQKTVISQLLSKPSACDFPTLSAQLKTLPPYLKQHFIFAVDVFLTVCQKGNVNSEMLTQLAVICAEMCCERAGLSNELLGAIRALCIPHKSNTKTGFTALTEKTSILADPGIHSNLLIFICLLLSHNVFRLQDIIVYVISPVIYVQLMNSSPGATPQSSRALDFTMSLILHLLVPDYSEGGHATSEIVPPIRLPPFVQDSLHAKCRELNLGYLALLLKTLLKMSKNSGSRERTKMGSLMVQSSGAGNEATLSKVRSTLETVASQDWVQDRASCQGSRLLESEDMLGDKSLTPSHARYLLHLLCPYSTAALPSDSSRLGRMEPQPALEHILKNLDQWTLRNALLHIDVHIQQSAMRIPLPDHLASEVIHVFEDSCGDEWLGQTIECSVESGDGSYSPRVWLVTPLVSQLHQSVLGRVLKSAGNVLGQGQWWNPEKNQEKRRSTRATSGVAPPKTGLQWQQPFLELVLACMKAQSAPHDELLGPLKSQLSTFLSAYDREGTPADEQSKTILYAAIKLRLSLVGSMLSSICSNEQAILEWVPLLMQLLCSGAVDRQTDTSELFTNCLDMLCTLLNSLPPEFHSCLAKGGEEGKKLFITCVKKLKMELNSGKSYCLSEIRQLFPLSQDAYTVTTVKQPDSVSLKTSYNAYTERIKGLRVQDSRDIPPWEILEGIKNNGPLMLSWFGGVRVKRKPLRFEEQRWLLRFHTHQDKYKEMMFKSSYVKLPEAVSTEVDKCKVEGQTPTVEGDKILGVKTDPNIKPAPPGQVPAGVNPQMPQAAMQNPTNLPPNHQFRANVPLQQAPAMPPQGIRVPPRIPVGVDSQRRSTLNEIRHKALAYNNQTPQQYRGGPMYGARPMNPPAMGGGQYNQAQVQRMIAMRQHHQRRQQQMMAMRNQMMQGQYGHYHPGHTGLQPMQANPPVPMHQVIRQGYSRPQMMPQQGVMQPGMQYQQRPNQPMGGMHRPGGMY